MRSAVIPASTASSELAAGSGSATRRFGRHAAVAVGDPGRRRRGGEADLGERPASAAASLAALALAACGSSQTTSSPSAPTHDEPTCRPRRHPGRRSRLRSVAAEAGLRGHRGRDRPPGADAGAAQRVEAPRARCADTRPRGCSTARGRPLPMRLDRRGRLLPRHAGHGRDGWSLAPGSRARYGLSFVTNNEYAGARRCISRRGVDVAGAGGVTMDTRHAEQRRAGPGSSPCGRPAGAVAGLRQLRAERPAPRGGRPEPWRPQAASRSPAAAPAPRSACRPGQSLPGLVGGEEALHLLLGGPRARVAAAGGRRASGSRDRRPAAGRAGPGRSARASAPSSCRSPDPAQPPPARLVVGAVEVDAAGGDLARGPHQRQRAAGGQVEGLQQRRGLRRPAPRPAERRADRCAGSGGPAGRSAGAGSPPRARTRSAARRPPRRAPRTDPGARRPAGRGWRAAPARSAGRSESARRTRAGPGRCRAPAASARSPTAPAHGCRRGRRTAPGRAPAGRPGPSPARPRRAAGGAGRRRGSGSGRRARPAARGGRPIAAGPRSGPRRAKPARAPTHSWAGDQVDVDQERARADDRQPVMAPAAADPGARSSPGAEAPDQRQRGGAGDEPGGRGRGGLDGGQRGRHGAARAAGRRRARAGRRRPRPRRSRSGRRRPSMSSSSPTSSRPLVGHRHAHGDSAGGREQRRVA